MTESHLGPGRLASGTSFRQATLGQFKAVSMAAAGEPRHYAASRNMTVDTGENSAVPVAVIDGPYDAAALSGVLAQMPTSLGDGRCDVNPSSACSHGTFIIGLLGGSPGRFDPGHVPGLSATAYSDLRG